MGDPTLLFVFLAGLLTCLATGLGALPLFWVRNGGDRIRAFGNAIAAGLMVAAGIQLGGEGLTHAVVPALAGIVAGALMMTAFRWLFPDGHGLVIGGLSGRDARKAVLIVGIMTLYSSVEGIGVGVAFGGGMDLGLIMTVAIALHNIPEGLAIALVLVPRGVSVPAAAAWSIASSLPQPLLSVPAFAFVLHFAPLLPFGLGLAAGAMMWLAVSEMLPEARDTLGWSRMLATMTIAAAILLAIGWLVFAA